MKKSKKLTFEYLPPVSYKIRAIIDRNANRVWDTGNLLAKEQPERIVFLKDAITLRANWTIDNKFIVK